MKKTISLISLAVATLLTGCGGGGNPETASVAVPVVVVDAGTSLITVPSLDLPVKNNGMFWDGFIEGVTQWQCRDSNTNKITYNHLCADQKVNDLKWPTAGVPATTNLWYRGAAIQSVCAENITRYVTSRAGQPYTWKKNENDITNTLAELGIIYHVVESGFWSQLEGVNVSTARSYTYKYDDNNWAVFVIHAPTYADFFPAQCRFFQKENGVFKALFVV
jgi:hypothetical protein